MLKNNNLINYLHERNRGMILGLLIVVFFVYLPFINNPLFFDDLPFFASAVPNYANLPLHFELRFLPYASLGWTWKHFLDTPLPLHVGNILLHFANSLLVFLLLHLLTNLIVIKNNQASSNLQYLLNFFSKATWGVWLGALCFACHPVAVYATGYVIQRSILMATLFTLAMQLTFLRGLISQQKHHQYAWLSISILFYLFAVFSKEHSLMAPAVLAAMALLVRQHILANKYVLVTTFIGFITIAVFMILKIKSGYGLVYEHDATALLDQQSISITNSSVNLHLLSIFTQAGLFFKYLFLWILPNPAWMSIDMRETFASSVNVWQWLKIFAFIVYGVITLKLLLLRGKKGLIGFALLYPWLMFIIEFSLVRIQEPFVLYRSYLWAPGLMLLIPLLFEILSNKIKIIMFALVIGLIPLSWNRLWVFADEYRLWNDAAIILKKDMVPGAARIFYNRGNAEFNKHRYEESIVDYKKVIVLFPKLEQAYTNIGNAYLVTNKYMLALESFNQAIAINPSNDQAYLGKAFALNRLHNKPESIKALNKSCQLKNVVACLSLTVIQKK